jgi:hypothetical protein
VLGHDLEFWLYGPGPSGLHPDSRLASPPHPGRARVDHAWRHKIRFVVIKYTGTYHEPREDIAAKGTGIEAELWGT